MRRAVVAAVVGAAAMAAGASPAWASSISVTASAGAGSVTAHVTGTADPCTGDGCATQEVQVEASLDADLGLRHAGRVGYRSLTEQPDETAA